MSEQKTSDTKQNKIRRIKMALFDKKSPAEKVIELYNKLSDEDKMVVKTHFGEKATDLKKAEDERAIDKIEEEKADSEEVKEEKSEDLKEESEEIGKDVNEAIADESEENKEVEEEQPTPEEQEVVEERHEDIFDGLNARLKALEDKFSKMLDSKEPESKERGISGYGSSEVNNMDVDRRKEDMIKKLGGYAR